MKQIVIDGIEYVPLGTVVSAECMKALFKSVHNCVWMGYL
jgi:hypothetical protein